MVPTLTPSLLRGLSSNTTSLRLPSLATQSRLYSAASLSTLDPFDFHLIDLNDIGTSVRLFSALHPECKFCETRALVGPVPGCIHRAWEQGCSGFSTSICLMMAQ